LGNKVACNFLLGNKVASNLLLGNKVALNWIECYREAVAVVWRPHVTVPPWSVTATSVVGRSATTSVSSSTNQHCLSRPWPLPLIAMSSQWAQSAVLKSSLVSNARKYSPTVVLGAVEKLISGVCVCDCAWLCVTVCVCVCVCVCFAFLVRQLLLRNLLSFTRKARKFYEQNQCNFMCKSVA
jgi:hypothetical protein